MRFGVWQNVNKSVKTNTLYFNEYDDNKKDLGIILTIQTGLETS